jgi:hypothetical protein
VEVAGHEVERSADASRTRGAARGMGTVTGGSAAPTPSAAGLMWIQQSAGNRAATLLVQRALATTADVRRSTPRLMSRLRATRELLTPRYMQRLTEKELQARGAAIDARMADAPQTSGFLWHLTEKMPNTSLYLLGTLHGNVLASLVKKKGLVDFLVDTTFDHVHAEMDQPNLTLDAQKIREAINTLEPLPNPPRTAKDRILHKNATKVLEDAGSLDQLYTSLAAKGNPILGLETQDIRDQIRAQYAAAAGPNVEEQEIGTTEDTAKLLGIEPGDLQNPSPTDTDAERWQTDLASQAGEQAPSPAMIEKGRRSRRAREKMEGYVTGGDERKLMEVYAGHLKKGLDPQDAEARNQAWATGVKHGFYYPGKTVIWVVGASHVGGLTVELSDLGWTVTAKTL